MRRWSRILGALIAFSVGLAGSPGADAVVVANREKTTKGCTVHVDDPHLSDYADVSGTRLWAAVAKTRVTCSVGVTFVDLGMLLFWCPLDPSGAEETWAQYGCHVKANQADLLQAPTVGQTYTRQVNDNAPQDGYYVACTQYVVTDGNGAERDNVWSASRYIPVPGTPAEIIVPPSPSP